MRSGGFKGFSSVAVAAALFLAAGCGGSGGDGSAKAHINEKTGAVNGAIPDERVGIKPPPDKQAGATAAAKAAGCYLLKDVPPKGEEEIAPGTPTPKYSSDPPTSGPHFGPPHQQADGAYLVTPEAAATVASLDHGRMTIQYAPDLPEEIQLELKGLFDTMYGGTLLFPNSTMNYAVAATTWGHVLGCTGYDKAETLNAIRAFGKETWGKYGEVPVKKFPVEGPTPANPEEPGEAGSG